MEGVAFASRRNIEIMKARGNKLERLVAAGGGAKTRLWLEIKASVYGCPILDDGRSGMRRTRLCDACWRGCRNV